MNLQIYHNSKIRISTDQNNNYINVSGLEGECGIAVNAYSVLHYIEIRKKAGCIGTFYFKNKGIKKQIDLGWWNDAEVIFALNEVGKN